LEKSKEVCPQVTLHPIDQFLDAVAKENIGCLPQDSLLSTTHSSFRDPNNPRFDPDHNFRRTLMVQEASKLVLKFYGHFTEEIPQSRLESTRVRNLEISLFSGDNTISVIEPKQRNSGIVQGLFLKRQNILAADGSRFLNVRDFLVGQTTIVSGHEICITGCDGFTRKFYDRIGTPQPANLPAPVDNFKSKVLQGFEPKTYYGINSYAFNGCIQSQKQFFENDRKVLKFYATFENELYIIYYFLSDDCIEVIEVKVPNSGKDPFPKLIKRQKIPRNYRVEIHLDLKQGEYFTSADFKEAEEITLLGKTFLILGCDVFTSRFYKEKMGVQFGVYQGCPEDDGSRTPLNIPPHNGFGSNEDSLQNVLRLVPKVPKKDYFSIVDNVGFLRVVARLTTAAEENKDR
jgi:hypothetical protein